MTEHAGLQVALKAKAKRFQVRTHLDNRGPNYNADAKAQLHLDSLVLDSTVAVPSTMLAAAVIKSAPFAVPASVPHML